MAYHAGLSCTGGLLPRIRAAGRAIRQENKIFLFFILILWTAVAMWSDPTSCRLRRCHVSARVRATRDYTRRSANKPSSSSPGVTWSPLWGHSASLRGFRPRQTRVSCPLVGSFSARLILHNGLPPPPPPPFSTFHIKRPKSPLGPQT